MKVRFWGVRGSFPVPGASTVRSGGNTSCVEVRLDAPDNPNAPRIISDAPVAYVIDTARSRQPQAGRQSIRQPPRPGDPRPPEGGGRLAAMREGVVRLCDGADLVIYDTQFIPAEYAERPHWGQSCPEDA